MHEDLPIEKLDSSIYDGKSLVSTGDVACVGNGRFFCFSKDGKLDLHILVRREIRPVLKTNSLVLFIE